MPAPGAPGDPGSGETEARLRQSWDRNAAAWTRAVRGGEIESRRLATDDAIVGAVLDQAPARVLDAGCGEGWLARALSSHGVEVVGYDGSAELIAEARQKGGGAFHHLSYEEFAGDPARWGGFDVVVSNFALLGEALQPLLTAHTRSLTPGGQLVIQTVHPVTAHEHPPYVDGWRVETYPGLGFPSSMPWYFRTLASWLGELRRAGLVLEEMHEPLHPQTEQPVSLILVSRPCPAPR